MTEIQTQNNSSNNASLEPSHQTPDFHTPLQFIAKEEETISDILYDAIESTLIVIEYHTRLVAGQVGAGSPQALLLLHLRTFGKLLTDDLHLHYRRYNAIQLAFFVKELSCLLGTVVRHWPKPQLVGLHEEFQELAYTGGIIWKQIERAHRPRQHPLRELANNNIASLGQEPTAPIVIQLPESTPESNAKEPHTSNQQEDPPVSVLPPSESRKRRRGTTTIGTEVRTV